MKPTIEVTMSPRLLGYVKQLVEMEGYGDTPEQVVLTLVWDRVNELIAARRFRFVPPLSESSDA